MNALTRASRLFNSSFSHAVTQRSAPFRALSTALNSQPALTRGRYRTTSSQESASRLSRPAALLICASSAATTFALASQARRVSALAEYSTAASAPAASDVKRTPEIVLYQYEVCPFCNKVRAYLDFHDLPYRVVEVDPLRKTELAKFDKSYRKVPIAIVNGEQVNGSGAVIERVAALMEHGGHAKPSEVERQWLTWLDDKLIHLVAPNIYRTMNESLQTFDYIADNAKFSSWQRGTIRYSGAIAMYFVARKLKNKYGIDDEREAILGALQEWTEAIKKGGGKFLEGRESPGVADLSVYGVLKSIETFDTFTEVKRKNEELAEWFDRTKNAVGQPAVTVRE
ncbi:unnamed protein product [Chondrus crispus]|uniref:Prostaglandin E synthase 2 n=1 Tax=Chondrus crispus TaxID=2769 RepID=R7QQ89_CHOCR|nr:unnamed protein product [Chondrus crispus]CDF40289.1 unnamed protein product [Chondrus crispus]|eukprot:XP_005710583.1 unnamed protein product [Chondrus crispus]